MIGFIRLAAISAVLSAGVVTADGFSATRESPASTKSYTDRVAASDAVQVAYAGVTPGDRRAIETVAAGKGDSQHQKPKSCEQQTWPNISRHCIASEGEETGRLVRTITIESRDGANTSVLTRVSAAVVAQR